MLKQLQETLILLKHFFIAVCLHICNKKVNAAKKRLLWRLFYFILHGWIALNKDHQKSI